MLLLKQNLIVVAGFVTTAISAGVEIVGYSGANCDSETGRIQLTLNECQALPVIAESYKVNTNDQGVDNFCDPGTLIVAGWQASSDCSDGSQDINIGPIANDAPVQEGSCGIARLQSVKLYCQ